MRRMSASKWPDECVQTLVDAPWWEPCPTSAFHVGQLVWTWVVFPDKDPLCLVPEQRQSATEHDRVLVKITRATATMRLPPPHPPVAALPHHEGELYLLHRAKRRPALVLSLGGPTPTKTAYPGASPANLSPKMILAPYYGADRTDKRGGYPEKLIDRIQHAEYPQYFWDRLPISPEMGSILRLDHVFAADDSQFIERTPWRLRAPHARLLAAWHQWLVTGELVAGSKLAEIWAFFQEP
jgi:hypothetical protein